MPKGRRLLMLSRTVIARVAAVTLISLLPLGCAHNEKGEKDQAKKLAQSDVPAKVMDSVNAKFPGATIRSAEKETENGQVIYDIELTQNGRHHEMDIQENGTVAETESAIPADQLPAAVSQAAQAKYPNSTVKEAMEKRKGTDTQVSEYEIVVKKSNGKGTELTITPGGKITEDSGSEEKGSE
jgi:uncharacterized membrane protein YkoI